MKIRISVLMRQKKKRVMDSLNVPGWSRKKVPRTDYLISQFGGYWPC